MSIFDHYQTKIDSIKLTPSFPVHISKPYFQSDKAITHLHIHDCLEIGYCYQGTGIFIIQNKSLPFSAGDFTIITPNEYHLAQSTMGTTSEWRFLSLDINFFLTQQWSQIFHECSGPEFINIFKENQNQQIASLFKMIVETLENPSEDHQEAFKHLIHLLAIQVKMMIKSKTLQKPSENSQKDYQKLTPAIHFITKHYANSIKVSTLAKQTHLSEPHFRRLFKQIFNLNPIDYINQYRIQMAAHLLLNSQNKIVDIALSCGFPTLSSFNRIFKDIHQISPKEYRKVNNPS